jgi:hypothetical protein
MNKQEPMPKMAAQWPGRTVDYARYFRPAIPGCVNEDKPDLTLSTHYREDHSGNAAGFNPQHTKRMHLVLACLAAILNIDPQNTTDGWRRLPVDRRGHNAAMFD